MWFGSTCIASVTWVTGIAVWLLNQFREIALMVRRQMQDYYVGSSRYRRVPG